MKNPSDSSTVLAERLTKKYEGWALVRGLIQLIPLGIGSALDTAFITHASNLREKRIETFFDELSSSNFVLTRENIDSEDFIHKFVITLNAVTRTHRREKIALLANFIRHGTTPVMDTDTFDEYLQIVEELSLRELTALSLLDVYESANPAQGDENDLQRATRFWPEFVKEVAKVTGLKEDDVEPFLTRISRTGCYELFVGSYWDYTGGKGKLTPLFSTLKKAIDCVHSFEKTDAVSNVD